MNKGFINKHTDNTDLTDNHRLMMEKISANHVQSVLSVCKKKII